MASEGDPKIRRIAIVLQSIDAGTARTLLDQFPADIARLIKRSLANLGAVSPAERALAEQELQQLIGGIKGPDRAAALHSPPSPAAQVLQQEKAYQDAFQLSPEAQKLASGTQVASSAQVWLNMPPEILAGVLERERPIVVAAVLHELPVVMATSVLQQLPIPIATETMAALPNLHRHDPAVLEELLDQVRSKVQETMQDETRFQSGLEKLKAIVAHAPADHRNLWSSALNQVDPKLPTALGWDRNASPVAQQETAPKIEHENKPSQSDDTPATIPFSQPESDRVFSSLVDLMQIDDADFVAVLHSVDPSDVLLALSNAEPPILDRVERLIPKKDISRFRSRIRQLNDVTLREIDAACEAILASAEKMESDGRIRLKRTSKRTSASFSAAA